MKYIEICIALILVFALLSIIVSMIAEQVNSWRKVRSEMLKKAILQMLNDPLNLNYGYLLINHPLVSSMKNPDGNRSFQYLEASIFAEALIDVVARQTDAGYPVGSNVRKDPELFPEPLTAFKTGVMAMHDSPLKDLFASMAAKSEVGYPQLKAEIENWYKCNTARMSGWYKRKQQKPLFIIAFLVSLFLNVDTIHLFRTIAIDDDLRSEMLKTAEQVVIQIEDSSHVLPVITDTALTIVVTSDTVTYLQLRRIPMGWSNTTAPLSWFRTSGQPIAYNDESPLDQYNQLRNKRSVWNYLLWFFGILMTAIMTCFGAPFWFDILAKFVNIRRSGTRPDDQPKQ